MCGELGIRINQSTFECTNGCNLKCYGAKSSKIHADLNAAYNIAKSTKIVTKKDDCTYYTLDKKKTA